ncbi:hypothetical protein ABBQ38_010709 [Trebouxia sp. C0009 RCD-2024]
MYTSPASLCLLGCKPSSQEIIWFLQGSEGERNQAQREQRWSWSALTLLAAAAFTAGVVAGYCYNRRSVDLKMSLTPAHGDSAAFIKVEPKADGSVLKTSAKSLRDFVENNPDIFK